MSELLKNLAWHRKQTAIIVNFSNGAASQDFSGDTTNAEWDKVDAALNEAGRVERHMALLEGGTEPFKRTLQKTWGDDDVTFTLPESISRESISSIYDVTDATDGYPLFVSGRWSGHTIFFKDSKTLQWGTSGPGRDTTLEFTYHMHPNVLLHPTDEAEWLPYEHRDLLNWSAACIMRDIADEAIPASWSRRLDEYRSLFHLTLARGVPAESNPPRIRNHRIGRR